MFAAPPGVYSRAKLNLTGPCYAASFKSALWPVRCVALSASGMLNITSTVASALNLAAAVKQRATSC
ncbi:MAG: hypothetical protein BroJett011_13760 [Chloroflexota bacterium]|nr:MAG: hypothetical protein BroJett011_13760 [Chloroflexota bacterium]